MVISVFLRTNVVIDARGLKDISMWSYRNVRSTENWILMEQSASDSHFQDLLSKLGQSIIITILRTGLGSQRFVRKDVEDKLP